LKQGESIQLERRGYFRCDKDLSQGQLELVMIPDGKTKSMSVLGSKVAKINHRANYFEECIDNQSLCNRFK